MRLVDDIHLHAKVKRRETRLINQRTHIFHAGVGSCVQFNDVHAAGFRNPAARAFSARLAGYGSITVERLRKDLRRAGLARSARARKEIRMRHVPFQNLVLQDGGNVLLSDHVLKALRAVFSV